MEFVIKICVCALYLLYLLEIIDADKICKVPNGDSGTCVQISKCQPLLDLYKKKYKTPHENTFFQQSFCGRPTITKIKVCCPPPALWSKFEAKPVIYPNTPVNSLLATPVNSLLATPVTKKPVIQAPEVPAVPEPAVLAIPSTGFISGELDTRNYPEEEEVNRVCGIDTSSLNKIIGGTEVAIDQYPWLALLQYAGDFLACGGSLINPKFVLTAAHCLDGLNGPPMYVRLAEYNTSSYPTDSVEVDGGGTDNITVLILAVKTTIRHPQFDRTQKIHDIGLIEMNASVKITSDFIKAICLPNRNFVPDFLQTTNFTIAGWGGTRVSRESEVKLELAIPYVPWDQCEKIQGPDVMNTQICAGGIEGQDSCEGDSGGPLMYEFEGRYYAVGIISYGYRTCGEKGKPATHTNVYRYISWIKDVLSGKITK